MTISIEEGFLKIQSPITGVFRDFEIYDEKFQKEVINLIKETIKDYGY